MATFCTLTKPPILWKRGAIWLALLGPFFFLSYGWVNYITSGRSDVHVIVEAWEHSIPFVPWLMLPYMSIDAFYAASLFLFRKRSALDRHALRLLLATVISLIGFLLFPLRFSFDVPKAEGFNGALQALLLGFDQPYNQAPSLHISLLLILWVVYAKKLNGLTKLALDIWFTAIAASVLLVYQHHFIDLWTGAVVGVVCLYLVPDHPFSWQWNKPTARMKQLAMRYLLGAVLLLIMGLSIRYFVLITFILIWSATALSLVALAYLGFEKHVFQRTKGQIAWPAKLLLAPYLVGSWLSYLYHTRTRHLPKHIYGNVWLGPFPRASTLKMKMDWNGVLDMTNEFPSTKLTSALSKFIPVLDLTSPEPEKIVKAVRWLDYAQRRGSVLVYCALGLSRSASVVVCWLVWRGHVLNIQEAINHMHQSEIDVLLSTEHEANIIKALNNLTKS
ncbi:MAG: dual specificity protein phosphatase family protein [Methylophilus sp.]